MQVSGFEVHTSFVGYSLHPMRISSFSWELCGCLGAIEKACVSV